MDQTVREAILASLQAASDYNQNDQVAPAAILWTDKERQWEPLLPRLRQLLPQLLTLGAYDPASRTGPAIWLKCMLARALPEADWPADVVPILYLPAIGRQELRAVEECPKSLQPLAELQYRAVYWTQLNARDWTLLAFLQSKDGGLGLDVARGTATLEAMRRALLMLSETPITALQGKRLEAADFDALLTPDPARDLLTWLNDPAGTRQRWDDSTWAAFRNICRQQYNFDPHTDGELVGAELLGSPQGAWQHVWERCAEAPQRYARLPDLLRRAGPKPADALFLTRKPNPVWPQDNEAMEVELHQSLLALKDKTPAEAAQKITALEALHGERRTWVWAELGQAPLARALHHLVTLAEVTKTALSGATPEAMARAYIEGGWRADAAVLESLTCVTAHDDVEAVCAAILAVYRPWLEDAARRFQVLVSEHPLPSYSVHATGAATTGRTRAESGCVILFADGLRFDIGQKLKAAMLARGWQVEERWHWVALPAVTATAKPAVSPVADQLNADVEADEFRPCVAATGKVLTAERFRQLLAEHGYQVLATGETGDPAGMGWAELGDLDHYGHNQGWKLAWRVDEVVREFVDRLTALLEAGWKKVRVVTDHGWLLLPGGLPKSELPGFLAETRWGRCAVLKETSVVDTAVVTWYWSPRVRVAMAPGIHVFKNGVEYAHGGVSVQECVALELTITQQGTSGLPATIAAVRWSGLRCRVQVEGTAPDLRLDIRTRAVDPSTSITATRHVSAEGPTALLVEDESYEGTAAIVVLLTADGRVLDRQATTVGE
jgi:hypothetical protein